MKHVIRILTTDLFLMPFRHPTNRLHLFLPKQGKTWRPASPGVWSGTASSLLSNTTCEAEREQPEPWSHVSCSAPAVPCQVRLVAQLLARCPHQLWPLPVPMRAGVRAGEVETNLVTSERAPGIPTGNRFLRLCEMVYLLPRGEKPFLLQFCD